jgi:hypothetical protein
LIPVDDTPAYIADTDAGEMPGFSAASDASAPRTPQNQLAKKSGHKNAARNIKTAISRAGSFLREGNKEDSAKKLKEAQVLLKNAKRTYPDWEEDVFDENYMKKYKKQGENSTIYEHPLNSGMLVKIMNKSEAKLNKTMGDLNIGPKVTISPRKQSKDWFNVIMKKIEGDT